MSLLRSRVHRYLSIPARLLTWDDIETAFESGLSEERDLDWKARLPLDREGKPDDEFAKDVTAMANTDGGVLIYGVHEQRGLIGLREGVDDATLRRLQQLLLERTAPFVQDVEMQVVTGNTDPVRQLLVVSVPASPTAPHFVTGYQRDQALRHVLRIVERRGSDTAAMDERALAQAYRKRFAALADVETRSAELRRFVADQCVHGASTAWVIVACTPTRPLPRPSRIDRHQVRGVLANAVTTATRFVPNDTPEVLSALEAIWDDPRTGYGRWVVSNFVAPKDSSVARPCYLELHHDGSVVAAIDLSTRVNDRTGTEPAPVEMGAVERAAGEMVAVTDELLSLLGSESDVHLSVELLRADPADGPFAAVRVSPLGRQYRDGFTRPVRRPQLVRAELGPVRTDSDLQAAAWELCDGVLSQFGADTGVGRPQI